MTHCLTRSCLGSLADDETCSCSCVDCETVFVPVRLFHKGFWYIRDGEWTVQRVHAKLFLSKADLRPAMAAYPDAWTIADPGRAGPQHCGHPVYCMGRSQVPEGCCGCGCPDCSLLSKGIRPQ